MDFSKTLQAIQFQARLLKRLRYKLKNQLRRAPEMQLLQALLRQTKKLSRLPLQVPIDQLKSGIFSAIDAIDLIQSFSHPLMCLGEVAKDFIERTYLVPFAVIILGCSARIWSGLERIKTSLRVAQKAALDYSRKKK